MYVGYGRSPLLGNLKEEKVFLSDTYNDVVRKTLSGAGGWGVVRSTHLQGHIPVTKSCSSIFEQKRV